MFTKEHILWLILCLIFIVGMTVWSCKGKVSLKTAGLVMTVICAFSESSKILSNMVESQGGGMHLDPLCLPFHLCSLMLFGVLYITFGSDGPTKQKVINFLAVMGTLGSIAALLIPTNGTDFFSIDAYQCFVYHAGLLWFSLYLILSKHAMLGIKSLLDDLAILLVLVVIMIYVNSLLSAYDTNFFYLTRPPMENLPFLNLDKGWYVYLLRIIGLGAGCVTLFHVPFLVGSRNR